MTRPGKGLSNPYSTGGGGVNFETRVQALFTVLMLTGGFAPCVQPWPIKKIKLQGKYAGYETDDFIVFAKDPNAGREVKLLAQIKHSISITEGDTTFGEVIHAAWQDFCNPKLFTPGNDAIALITGPLSASDIQSVRRILELARDSEDASDFITKVEKIKFSSNEQRNKLTAFRSHLKEAKGADVSDDELWRFMKDFHLLGYDLDIKAGVTLSLLQSLIGQYSPENAQNLWSRIVDEVQSANQSAGTLNSDSLSKDIVAAFTERTIQRIPEQFIKEEAVQTKSNLSQIPHAADLAIANVLGAWSEASNNDKIVIERLSGSKYAEWIGKMRDILLQPNSPLSLKSGAWNINERREAWYVLGPRLFDEHLDRLKEVAVSVLRERDPQFELPPDERWGASIHGRVLGHSHLLRNGLAESLALVGSHPKALTSCSVSKPEVTGILAVREILADADWVVWASLNHLLPLLAEAAPGEFLGAVENSLNSAPCPFDTVFAQEAAGIMGRNYMTGLLWALETLAWDAEYLTRVTVVLGELAARDPGGNWGNRPINSLSTILLPWLPQTCAPVQKRQTAVATLLKELPDVAWKLLLVLVPSSHQVSSGSHKPAWREMIPNDWSGDVTQQEYWEQVSVYAEFAVTVGKENISKVAELVDRLPDLPRPARDQLVAHLCSEAVVSIPEKDRLPLWNELVNLVSKHRRFAGAEWAMKPDVVNQIASVAERLAPDAPIYRYQRLFSERDHDLFEEKGNYEEQRKELEERRQRAVNEVFEDGGKGGVLEFAKAVESPWRVGFAVGLGAVDDVEKEILPALLESETKSLAQFTGGFIWGRFLGRGWKWVDAVDTSQWSPSQKGQFLAYLPFTPDTWQRTAQLLGQDEGPYWSKASVNPYQAENSLELSVNRLIEYGRPYAAIRCLEKLLDDKKSLDQQQAIRALKAALRSPEDSHTINADAIVEVIRALQDDPNTNPDDLFQVEWAFLPLLDRHRGASPKLLERRLADDADFFCEVIRTVYRSEKEEPPTAEPTEEQKNIVTSAYRLLREWSAPPGCQQDGGFTGRALAAWLERVKAACTESGHLAIALSRVGQVLVYAPPDPDGLWVHRSVATVLNAKDAEAMRDGFRTQLFNLRGVHSPTGGKEERELGEKYRRQAEEVEDRGYHRLASSLRELADSYDRDAEREAQRPV